MTYYFVMMDVIEHMQHEKSKEKYSTPFHYHHAQPSREIASRSTPIICVPNSSRPCSLNALACDLPAVEASKGTTGRDNIILCAFNFFIRNTEDDFDVAGVALVGVDTTVCTVRAAAGFLRKGSRLIEALEVVRLKITYGCLLDDNVLDVEVLELKVFRVRVRLRVLQEAENELDGLLGPTTLTSQRDETKTDIPWRYI